MKWIYLNIGFSVALILLSKYSMNNFSNFAVFMCSIVVIRCLFAVFQKCRDLIDSNKLNKHS